MVLGDGMAESISGAAGDVNSKLSLRQKASVGSRLLPSPRTNHPYIVGLIMVTVGGFALVGSLTGNLPAMIAALFVPNALEDKHGNNGGALESALSTITPFANKIASIGNPLMGLFTKNLS